MEQEKKPDQVVFNVVSQKYDASQKPYATSLGAPVITATDNVAWKNRSINKINRKVEVKYSELKLAYQNMMDEFEYNKLIFNAKFTFEPIVGEVYHLYQRENGEHFLSIIAPHQCDFNAVGSFYLNADQIWEKLTTSV